MIRQTEIAHMVLYSIVHLKTVLHLNRFLGCTSKSAYLPWSIQEVV